MPDSISLREMTRSDINDVYEIECESFITPWSKRAITEELTNDVAYYCVMRIGRDHVAYAGMWTFLDEAHITNIAVRRAFRGRGYSKILMQHMMDTARRRGAERMTLEVRENNMVAQNLYKSFGFETAGMRKGYYADTGESAYIMWAKL